MEGPGEEGLGPSFINSPPQRQNRSCAWVLCAWVLCALEGPAAIFPSPPRALSLY